MNPVYSVDHIGKLEASALQQWQGAPMLSARSGMLAVHLNIVRGLDAAASRWTRTLGVRFEASLVRVPKGLLAHM